MMISFKTAMVSVLVFIISATGMTVSAQSTKTVSGTIGVGNIDITLTAEDAADTVIINLFSDGSYFAEQFVGYNFVYPGLYRQGSFTIHNNTGEAYTVADYSFHVDSVSIQRTSNEASISNGLTVKQLATLSGDEWYNMNADYFGEQNFDDINILRKMFVSAPGLSGQIASRETSPEMIALAQKYLYMQCQFSFDIETYPIESRSLSGASIALWDYMNKTEANQDNVFNGIFQDEIGSDGFYSTIAYTNDYDYIGNAYNGSYIDFRFTLTLKRNAAETESSEPENSDESENLDESTSSDESESLEESTISDESTSLEESTVLEESANPIPETGDSDNFLWLSFLCVSAVVLTCFVFTSFRKAKI